MTSPLPPGHTRPLTTDIRPQFAQHVEDVHTGQLGIDVPGLGLTCGCEPPESTPSATIAADVIVGGPISTSAQTPIAAPETPSAAMSGPGDVIAPGGYVIVLRDELEALQAAHDSWRAEAVRWEAQYQTLEEMTRPRPSEGMVAEPTPVQHRVSTWHEQDGSVTIRVEVR